MLVGPAEIADRTEINKTDFQLLGGRRAESCGGRPQSDRRGTIIFDFSWLYSGLEQDGRIFRLPACEAPVARLEEYRLAVWHENQTE